MADLMLQRFGDRDYLSIEVGEPSCGLRRVDIWAANRHLTYYDNNVYVPQFLGDVEHAIRFLRSGRDLSFPFLGLSPEETHAKLDLSSEDCGLKHWFLRWGPTTDDVATLIFRSDEFIHLTFKFHHGTNPLPPPENEIFAARIPERDLLTTLERTAEALRDVPEH